MPIVDPSWPRADVWLASDDPSPELVVVGVPSSRSSLSPSRADLMPLVLRERLGGFSTFHGERGIDLAPIRVSDRGNWPVSQLEADALIGEVMALAGNLPEAALTLYLGGDNAITRPLVASAAGDLSRVGVITFDAHHDVRSLERGPTNGSPIRGLIEEHGLPGGNVVQIGIHSFANSMEYRRYADASGITTVTVEQVEKVGMRTVVDVALSQLGGTCDAIYVDVDVDVLDPAHAPACPGARPGGLTVRQLSEGVMRCAAHPAVRAMDFVEVDPERDIAHRTVDVTAHLMLTAAAGYASR